MQPSLLLFYCYLQDCESFILFLLMVSANTDAAILFFLKHNKDRHFKGQLLQFKTVFIGQHPPPPKKKIIHMGRDLCIK